MTLDTTQAYGVLGLAPGASPDEVKTAYRDLVKVWHPDRFEGNERLREKAQRQLQLYNEAYERLRDFAPAAPVSVATPAATPPDGLRRAPSPRTPHVKYSMFTGSMNAVRHSLKVLWPSATYLRKKRRRLPPPAWIAVGILALLFAAFGFAALVYEGFLDF